MTLTVVRLYLIYAHLLFFEVAREVQHDFSSSSQSTVIIREPEVYRVEFRFSRQHDKGVADGSGKLCLSESKVSRRKSRDGRLCPLSLDHSALFQVAGIMSRTQLCYVLKRRGC